MSCDVLRGGEEEAVQGDDDDARRGRIRKGSRSVEMMTASIWATVVSPHYKMEEVPWKYP